MADIKMVRRVAQESGDCGTVRTCGLGHALSDAQHICPTCGMGALPQPQEVHSAPVPQTIESAPSVSAAQVTANVVAQSSTDDVLSPDGLWRWSGTEWVAASPATISEPALTALIASPAPASSIESKRWSTRKRLAILGTPGLAIIGVVLVVVLNAAGSDASGTDTSSNTDQAASQPAAPAALSPSEQCVQDVNGYLAQVQTAFQNGGLQEAQNEIITVSQEISSQIPGQATSFNFYVAEHDAFGDAAGLEINVLVGNGVDPAQVTEQVTRHCTLARNQ